MAPPFSATSDIRPIDYNGHVPDDPDPGFHADHWDEAKAQAQRAQENVYKLAELLGITRAELNARAGVTA